MPILPDIYPPDYSTVIGQIRLLIPDVEQISDPAGSTASYIFSDSQIQAFASLYSDNIKRAAAQAISTLATSETLINKVIRTYDVATDGAKLGAELRAQAAELRKQADQDYLVDSHDSFSIVASSATDIWSDSWL